MPAYNVGTYPPVYLPTHSSTFWHFFEILYWLTIRVSSVYKCSTRYASLHIAATTSITIIHALPSSSSTCLILHKKKNVPRVYAICQPIHIRIIYTIWSCETKTLSYAVTNHNKTRPHYIHNNNIIRYTVFVQNVWNYNILYLYSGDLTNNINTLLW